MARNRQFSLVFSTAVLFAGLMIPPARAQMNIVTGPVNNGGLTVTCSPGPQLVGPLDTYLQTCRVSGGSGVYSWTVSGMPKTFSMTQNNGTMTITGIPYQMQTDTMMVTAFDSNDPPLTGSNTVAVVVQAGIGFTASRW